MRGGSAEDLIELTPRELRVHAGTIKSVSVATGLGYVATGSLDNFVGLTTRRDLHTEYLKGHESYVNSVSFAPIESRFLSGGKDGRVILWDCEKADHLVEQKQCHQLPVQSVHWSSDGKHFASGSNDGSVAIWSVARFVQRQTVTAVKGWVRCLDWHEDVLVCAGDDCYVSLVDARTGRVEQLFDTTQKVLALALSGDLSMIASAGSMQSVCVYDLRMRSKLQEHSGHTQPVTGVAFRPGMGQLLSVGMDGWVRLWDLENAAPLASKQTRYPLQCCAWASSGREFWVAGDERRLISWQITERPDLSSFPLDGWNVLDGISLVQEELNKLSAAVKAIDRRLLMQEEKLQWLSETNDMIG